MSPLAELHDELRTVARDLLGKAPGGVPEWAQLASAGWLGLEVPEDCDGAGATFAEVAVVLEEMGRAATASPYLGTSLGVGALCAVEPTDVVRDLLRRVAGGEAAVAVALTAGGDQVDLRPPFRLEASGGPRLRGEAAFVVDAPVAHRLLLLAADPDGVPVLVSVDQATAAVTPQPVLDATRSLGAVVADGAPVDEADVWRFTDDPVAGAQRLLDRAAVAVACDSIGLAEAMLDATVAYAGVRRQFDRPIGSFQAVKHQCADMLVQLTVGRRLLDEAVAAVAEGSPDAGTAASRAKSFVSAAAVDVVGAAMQLHGGIGYTWESGIHVHLKRAVLDRALFGSPSAHRRRLASHILAGR
ncbi:MAG TPA: acyl-CoA dehydrogenase family protein [Acidimicrobiales bacterium]|nr:acyl-CoA dehydrogenase family protein [Acidimicrobiales bacterium]